MFVESCNRCAPMLSSSSSFIVPLGTCSKVEDTSGDVSLMDKNAMAEWSPWATADCTDPMEYFDRLLSCADCCRVLCGSEQLLVHRRADHPLKPPQQCVYCGKCFKNYNLLGVHLKIHGGPKLHSCKECSAQFSLKYSLDRHMQSHSGERPFVCSVCAKRFRQKTHLMKHLLFHIRN